MFFFLPLISYAFLTACRKCIFVSIYFSNMCIYYGEGLKKKFGYPPVWDFELDSPLFIVVIAVYFFSL